MSQATDRVFVPGSSVTSTFRTSQAPSDVAIRTFPGGSVSYPMSRRM